MARPLPESTDIPCESCGATTLPGPVCTAECGSPAVVKNLDLDLVHAGGAMYLALVRSAESLIAEIEKRDGEGNTIPEHLYAPLRRAIARIRETPSNRKGI